MEARQKRAALGAKLLSQFEEKNGIKHVDYGSPEIRG